MIRKEDALGREKTREEGGRDAKCNCVFGFEGERAKCRRHLFVGVGAQNQPYLSVTNAIDPGRLLSRVRSRDIWRCAVSLRRPFVRLLGRRRPWRSANMDMGYVLLRPKSHCFRLSPPPQRGREIRRIVRIFASCRPRDGREKWPFLSLLCPRTGRSLRLRLALFGPLALLYTSFPLTTPPAAFGELENDGRGYLHSVEP